MRRLAAIASALVMLAGALALVSARPAAAELDSFQSPSKGIACIYDDGVDTGEKPFLSCEVRGYYGTLPPRPKDCDLDWEPRGILTSTGKAVIGACAGDTLANPDAPVLAYGSTFHRGAFTCVSATTGMTCRNRSGAGFLASKRVLKRV